MKNSVVPFFVAVSLTFPSISTAQENRVDTLQFSVESNLLIFEGSLNGVKTKFAFDTGAGLGVLNTTQVAESNVTKTGNKNIRDSNDESKTMSNGKIESMQIGSYRFSNVESVIFDMPFLTCQQLYLLGGDVINQLNWKFDFERQQAYVSKTPFSPSANMSPMSVYFVKNRHFTDIQIGDKTLKKCLIDFGYVGTLEASKKEPALKAPLKIELKQQRVIETNTISLGLTSIAVGLNMRTFFIDSIQLGSLSVPHVKVNIKDDVEKKIGLAFFRDQFSMVILNNSEHMYWLQPRTLVVEPTLGYDADYYLIDGKLQLVGKNLRATSTSSSLTIGQEIKSANGRTAASFSDICDFIAWRITQAKLDKLVIETLNGEQLTIPKTTF